MCCQIFSALQNVTLTSTLTEDLVAYDEQEIVFTCTTLFSNILQWNSSEYIGSDSHIQVYNGALGTDVRRGNAHATLVRAAIEDGVLVLVSELHIRASTLYPTATVECNNNGHGSNQTIIFNSISKIFYWGFTTNYVMVHGCTVCTYYTHIIINLGE